jgi:hypothetical protein
MKVNLTIEVSDEALIAIGLGTNGTLTRATRIEARTFLASQLYDVLKEQEAVVTQITATVLDTLGMNVVPIDVTAGVNEAEAL